MKTKILSILALLLTAVTQGTWAQTGIVNGSFSVSATKRVYFSKGNLQLVGENTFQFAENQWDYFGSNQSDNHRDLFSWGTGNNPNQTTGNSTFTDWGDNTYLQATLGKGWRTMTKDEFVYVFNTRASGSSVFGNANGRYTTATINTDGTGVNGLILFPDGITIAASEVTTAGTINSKGTVTKCTTAQWAALAEKGCVFLPAGGYFVPASAIGGGYGDITDYWSSTAADASKAYNLSFNFGYSGAVVSPAGTLGYNYGCSVRLVIDDVTVYTFYHDLTLADGTEDAANWQGKAGEGKYQQLPLEGVFAGTAVSLKYGGALKVKSVKAKKAAPANVPVESITLNKTATEIAVGQTETLSVTAVAPDNATDPTYTWKTSDETKATVDQNGVVTAVAAGTVNIYAEANDGSGVKGNCAVTVTPAFITVTAITLNKTETLIMVGATETLSVTSVLPEEATDKTYTWKTSDETKATVDQDGKVTAVAAGTVTIYAEANDGSGVKGTCAVTVKVAPTLANTMTNADMTVKVNYNYANEENYCLFVSNGDGTYTFQSGYGSFGGNDGCAKALVVEGDVLVFSLVDHPDFDDEYSWYNRGFLVAFDPSNNTYSQWKGENVGNSASFISVEVNGTQIAVTAAQ